MLTALKHFLNLSGWFLFCILDFAVSKSRIFLSKSMICSEKKCRLENINTVRKIIIIRKKKSSNEKKEHIIWSDLAIMR